jgi:hypothetical protein
MVAKVRILNKQIIEERHKRAEPGPTSTATEPSRDRIIDLSHTRASCNAVAKQQTANDKQNRRWPHQLSPEKNTHEG